MSEQFQNPVETKVENDTNADISPQKDIGKTADKAAAQSAKTEQKFDKDNLPLFSR